MNARPPCVSLEGWGGDGDGKEVHKEGRHVYLRLIHAEV